MYCPKCGNVNSTDQRFCRACGLQLEKTVQSLTEQLPAGEIDKNAKRRQRMVERLLQIVGGGAVSIVVAGVLWGIIYEIIIVKGEVFGGSIFLTLIVGAIVFGLLAMYRESLRKQSTERPADPESLRSPNTAELLQSSPLEGLSSVTDRTTELMSRDQHKSERQP